MWIISSCKFCYEPRNDQGRLFTKTRCTSDRVADGTFPALVNQPTATDFVRTPLHIAAASDNLESARLLLDNLANIEAVDRENMTPLNCAAYSGSSCVLQLLLRHNANLESKDVNGWTPLMNACVYGGRATFELLAAQDPPLGQTDHIGDNLLTISTDTRRNGKLDLSIFNSLLDNGVDLHQENVHGINAAHHILANKSQVYLRLALQRHPMLLHPSRIRWLDPKMWNGLRGSFGVMSVIRSLHILHRYFGAEQITGALNKVDPGGYSFLWLAASLGSLDEIRLLLSMGSNMEHEAGEEGTPLVAACAYRRLDAAKLLVRYGANLQHESRGNGRSAVAAAQCFPEIMNWLLVGRFTDQRRLKDSGRNECSSSFSVWSGIRQVGVPIQWQWKQGRHETMMDYARRLDGIRIGLRGTVVRPLEAE